MIMKVPTESIEDVYEEPKVHCYTVTVRKTPTFLIKAAQQTLFGWWFKSFKWKVTVWKGLSRYEVEVYFTRNDWFSGYVIGEQGKITKKWKYYKRMGVITAIRVLWLLLWSKKQ